MKRHLFVRSRALYQQVCGTCEAHLTASGCSHIVVPAPLRILTHILCLCVCVCVYVCVCVCVCVRGLFEALNASGVGGWLVCIGDNL